MRGKISKKQEWNLGELNHNSTRKTTAFVSILACYLLISQISFAQKSKLDANLTRAEIGKLAEAPRSDQRQKAAEFIMDAVGLDTTWAFDTIIKGIRIEQDYQLGLSQQKDQGSYWTSWRNIQQYVRALAALGLHSPHALRNFGENLTADQKTWVLIAEGYQKKDSLHDKLVEIFTGKSNPLQKAMAIEAISQYKDSSDVPILVDAALDHENSIEWAPESDLPGFNPVAEAGTSALWQMGYVLKWDSKKFKFELKRLEDVENKYPGPR